MKHLLLLLALCLASHTTTAQVIYVDANSPACPGGNGASWTTAYCDLQTAISAAQTGQQIWVAQGVYYPALAADGSTPANERLKTFFINKAIKLYGGFAGHETQLSQRNWALNPTILNGNLGNPAVYTDNAYHVVWMNNVNAATRLDGFTIEQGYANGSGANNDDVGAGLYLNGDNASETSPVLANCTFRDNHCFFSGGGAAVYIAARWDGVARPLFLQCLFFQSAGYSQSMVRHYVRASGICEPTYRHCTFSRQADESGTFEIHNHVEFGAPQATRVHMRAYNSIVWNNRYATTASSGGFTSATRRVDLFNCLTDTLGSNVFPTASLLHQNPQFADLPAANLRLTTGSPAINSGHNAYRDTLSVDLALQPRTVNGVVDMGVYEFNSDCAQNPLLVGINLTVGSCMSHAEATVAGGSPPFTFFWSNGQTGPVATSLPPGMYSVTATDVNGCTTTSQTQVTPPAGPQVIYVHANASGANTGQSWDNAFVSLQTALDAAATCPAGTQIWVAQGSYRPSCTASGNCSNPLDRNNTFYLDFPVAIYGGFSPTGNPGWADRDPVLYPTLLSGDLAANDPSGINLADLLDHPARQDNAYTIVHTFEVADGVTFDGFTLIGGNANEVDGNAYIPQRSGGAWYNHAPNPAAESSPRISNCIFTENSADYAGGGLYSGLFASPQLTQCRFLHNLAAQGGGIFNQIPNGSEANLILSHCTFEGNTATETTGGGGGLHNTGWSTAGPTLTHCAFNGNTSNFHGGAMYNVFTRPKLQYCSFAGNSARTGGAISILSSASGTYVTNCVFLNNTALTSGGAIYYAANGLQMTNSTLAGNVAGNSGGWIYGPTGSINLVNSVVWNNLPSSSPNLGATIHHSIVEGGWPGVGNLDVDPLFVDLSGGDVHLRACSPAIEAGTADTTGLLVPSTDLDGNARIVNARIDLGAYEFQGIPDAIDTVLFSLTPVSCFGGEDGAAVATVSNAGAGYIYQWNNGQTGSTLTGLASGSYTLTVTSPEGCSASATAFIAGPSAALSLTTQGTNANPCAGQTGEAAAMGAGGVLPYNYQWSNGQTGPVVTDLQPGVYSVTVTDANGCTDTSTVEVSATTSLSLSIQPESGSDCSGQSGSMVATASGGLPPYVYVWSNGQTGPIATNLSTGAYSVTATDALGCIIASTDSVVVSSLLILSAEVEPSTPCLGLPGQATAAAQGGVPPYQYAWSTGQTGPVATGLPPGMYSVTATDALGCVDSTEVWVDIVPMLLTQISIVQQPTCATSGDGAASVTITGGTPPYDYTWSDGQTTPNPTGLNAGQYAVAIVDAAGCMAVDTLALTPTSHLLISLNVLESIHCFGDSSARVLASPMGGEPPYTFIWDNGDTSALRTGLPAGTYALTITDANGCTTSGAAVFTNPAALFTTITSTEASCSAATDGQASVHPNGGTPPYSYAWSNGYTGHIATTLAPGSYTVTISDSQGCQISQQVDILAGAYLPNLTLSLVGNTLEVAEPDAQYQWIDCATALPVQGATSQSFEITQPGQYAVVVSNDAHCSAISDCWMVVSTLEAHPAATVEAFPNPAHEWLTLSLPWSAQVVWCDLAGKVWRSGHYPPGQHTVDLRELARGVYLLGISHTGAITTTIRLVVQ